jgi:hypothetical protein
MRISRALSEVFECNFFELKNHHVGLVSSTSLQHGMQLLHPGSSRHLWQPNQSEQLAVLLLLLVLWRPLPELRSAAASPDRWGVGCQHGSMAASST